MVTLIVGGILIAVMLALGLYGLRQAAAEYRHVRRTVQCPVCMGNGVIPIADPNGDPQLDSERTCPDCLGDGRTTEDEVRASRADLVANRIEHELERRGYRIVVSHYRSLDPGKRWEAGALWRAHAKDPMVTPVAGPVTGATRLTAVSRLAGALNIDVRRIPS